MLTGYDDNASGVSVLLELSRALSMSECRPEFTVVLAALDMEEYGTQGSLAFVQEFLIRRILEPMGYPGFQVWRGKGKRDSRLLLRLIVWVLIEIGNFGTQVNKLK